ncbi:hypothetical protein, partial [Natrialba swarupiae]|uniref:hypothetical protein n=1 Tax=Natrialba swarupiae TaxID=2448032 RepID=UPI001EE43FEA
EDRQIRVDLLLGEPEPLEKRREPVVIHELSVRHRLQLEVKKFPVGRGVDHGVEPIDGVDRVPRSVSSPRPILKSRNTYYNKF